MTELPYATYREASTGEAARIATPGAARTVRLDPESFGLVPSGTPDAALLAKWFTYAKF